MALSHLPPFSTHAVAITTNVNTNYPHTTKSVEQYLAVARSLLRSAMMSALE
jgi:hypothetical protein